jgi:hypothetical protein
VGYSTVQCSVTVQYSTVQYRAVQYSIVQYRAVQYSTVQSSAVQYSTVQYSTVQYNYSRKAVQYSAHVPYPTSSTAWFCTLQQLGALYIPLESATTVT